MNFWIPGDPKAQPRAKTNRYGGSYSKETKEYKNTIPWREAIRLALLENCRFGFDNYDTAAFSLSFWFQFRRPKSDFVNNKYSNPLKNCSPEFHIKRPDVDNLAKLPMDEFEKFNKELEELKAFEQLFRNELKANRIYKNDSQIIKLLSMKTWSIEPGCLVSIREIRTYQELMESTQFDEKT